jgi:serine/threonine protein kinase
MGVVYRGEHKETGEAVAIKTVRAPSADLLSSIRREIQALSRVRHPSIVRILGEGVSDGLPWYVMPLLQGRTLRQHILTLWAKSGVDCFRSTINKDRTTVPAGDVNQGPQSIATPMSLATTSPLGPTLTLLRRLCAPLAFLHGEGLVHRDLKPENIFLQDDGRPVLVDLGIAARFGGAEGREELDIERIAGTPAYMAPEQFRGELVDARADLYALGCILYECVTGQPPFLGEVVSLRYQHLYDKPRPPSLLVPNLPAELDRLILQLLEKRPQDRLGHAADVAAALIAVGADAEPEVGARARAYLYRPELTGRADELSRLVNAVDRVSRHRHGSLVLIRGESGVGKTRLAMEMAQIATQRGLTVLTGRCMALAAGETSIKAGVMEPPLHPLRPVLLAAADRAQERGRPEVERLFGSRGTVLAAYEPTLLDLPGQREQPPPTLFRRQSGPSPSRRRLSWCSTISSGSTSYRSAYWRRSPRTAPRIAAYCS